MICSQKNEFSLILFVIAVEIFGPLSTRLNEILKSVNHKMRGWSAADAFYIWVLFLIPFNGHCWSSWSWKMLLTYSNICHTWSLHVCPCLAASLTLDPAQGWGTKRMCCASSMWLKYSYCRAEATKLLPYLSRILGLSLASGGRWTKMYSSSVLWQNTVVLIQPCCLWLAQDRFPVTCRDIQLSLKEAMS